MSQKIIFSNGEEHDLSELHPFEPVIYFHPGECLAEKLQEMGVSVAEFAERLSLPEKVVSDVVHCKASITEPLAEAFFRGTKIPTYFWLAEQKDYDAYLLRKHQARAERKAQRLRPQVTHEDVVQHPLSTPLRPLPTSVGVYA